MAFRAAYTLRMLPPSPPRAKPNEPRLLDRVRSAIFVRHYSRRTEEAYIYWLRRYVRFNGIRHPRELGRRDVERFLSNLATEGRVSGSTQNQALSALLFLYREVIGEPLDWLEDVVRAKRPARLPVVLTRDEVRLVLGCLTGIEHLMTTVLYGTGMRLAECASEGRPGFVEAPAVARRRLPRPRAGGHHLRPPGRRPALSASAV